MEVAPLDFNKRTRVLLLRFSNLRRILNCDLCSESIVGPYKFLSLGCCLMTIIFIILTILTTNF